MARSWPKKVTLPPEMRRTQQGVIEQVFLPEADAVDTVLFTLKCPNMEIDGKAVRMARHATAEALKKAITVEYGGVQTEEQFLLTSDGTAVRTKDTLGSVVQEGGELWLMSSQSELTEHGDVFDATKNEDTLFRLTHPHSYRGHGRIPTDLLTVRAGCHCPVVGTAQCFSGVSEWTLLVTGSTNVYIGAALADADLTCGMHCNEGSWGLEMGSRKMHFADSTGADEQRRSEDHYRATGPDSFNLPCTVTLRLNRDTGVLMFGVADQMQITVVYDDLPLPLADGNGVAMNLAIGGFYSAACVRILSFKTAGS